MASFGGIRTIFSDATCVVSYKYIQISCICKKIQLSSNKLSTQYFFKHILQYIIYSNNMHHKMIKLECTIIMYIFGIWYSIPKPINPSHSFVMMRQFSGRIRVFAVTFTHQCLVTGDGLYRRGRLFGALTALTALTTVGSWL